MKNLTVETAVEMQVKTIKESLKNNKNLTITIIDAVCALDFKAYAKKEKWDDVNKFEIEFEDAFKVRVSRDDFIKYHFLYTQLALELEAKFSGELDCLREAQHDAQQILNVI